VAAGTLKKKFSASVQLVPLVPVQVVWAKRAVVLQHHRNNRSRKRCLAHVKRNCIFISG